MLRSNNRHIHLLIIGLALIGLLLVSSGFFDLKSVISRGSHADIYYKPFSSAFAKKGEDKFLSGDSYDNFHLESFSITRKDHNKVLFKFAADEIIHRKRRTKVFVYQNLKEINLSKVRIDIYPPNPEQNIMLFENISSSIASIGKPGISASEYLAGSSDPDLDLLTRLLIEDITINIHLPKNKSLSLLASHAKINADFDNVVLHGEVKLTASDRTFLRSPLAVYSKKHNGIYLPDGYTFKNNYYKKKAFVKISEKGEILRQTKIPLIEYTDPIEEKEKIFYAKISKNLPLHLRLMFGMP